MATGLATDADIQELARWRAQRAEHAAAYAKAERLWRLLEAPLQADARRRSARPINRRLFVGGAMAASVAAAGAGALLYPPLGLWPSLNEISADYRTAVGEQRKLGLADDTSIEMNTRTSLNVGDAPNGVRRIEIVEGEAAVTAGGREVQVQAGAGSIAAANAQFIVRCDDNGVRVTCIAGRVDVSLNGQTSEIGLHQQVAYAGKLGAVASIDPEVPSGWRDGLLIFNNEPFGRVVDEVNRYRPGRIIVMNGELAKRQVTARFKLDRLDSVIVQFSEVFGAKVTALPGGVVVVS